MSLGVEMWNCKECNVSQSGRFELLKHITLQRRRWQRYPCPHTKCPCTFKTWNALHIHLSRVQFYPFVRNIFCVVACVKYCCTVIPFGLLPVHCQSLTNLENTILWQYIPFVLCFFLPLTPCSLDFVETYSNYSLQTLKC